MRSVDNIYIVAELRYLNYNAEDNEKNLMTINEIVQSSSQLNKCLKAWKKIVQFPGNIFPTVKEYETAVVNYNTAKEKKNIKVDDITRGKRKRGTDPSNAIEHSVLSYRVTCERNGIHTFISSQVATSIGGEFQDKYHWIVDLTSYQLEILCKINHGIFINILLLFNFIAI